MKLIFNFLRVVFLIHIHGKTFVSKRSFDGLKLLSPQQTLNASE